MKFSAHEQVWTQYERASATRQACALSRSLICYIRFDGFSYLRYVLGSLHVMGIAHQTIRHHCFPYHRFCIYSRWKAGSYANLHDMYWAKLTMITVAHVLPRSTNSEASATQTCGSHGHPSSCYVAGSRSCLLDQHFTHQFHHHPSNRLRTTSTRWKMTMIWKLARRMGRSSMTTMSAECGFAFLMNLPRKLHSGKRLSFFNFERSLKTWLRG